MRDAAQQVKAGDIFIALFSKVLLSQVEQNYSNKGLLSHKVLQSKQTETSLVLRACRVLTQLGV